MAGFASSKGLGVVVSTTATRDLLIAAMNADLGYRRNLHAVPTGVTYQASDGSVILLEDAGHIAGSAQVQVTDSDGYRTGYSGDFAWPLEAVIEVDELVVDATYGSPTSVRRYSQAEAEGRFVEEALSRLKTGPVIVHAHRGTLQRAIGLLDNSTSMPLLGSRLQREESLVTNAMDTTRQHLSIRLAPMVCGPFRPGTIYSSLEEAILAATFDAANTR